MLRLSLEGLLAGALSVACAVWVLRLWRADLGLPLRYGPVDDTKFYLMLVKGIIEHGWYQSNPALGFPFGQQLYDYPQGADNLNLAVIRGLALFSSNPALVINLFFLLTFALASFTSHLVLRSLGVSAPVALLVSVLFSLLAYHFFRGESHLLLSAYYGVPLAAWLFLRLLAGAPLFAGRASPTGRRRPRLRWLTWASARSLATIAVCVVIGSDNLYYATFAAVLLVVATIVALSLRLWRTFLHGALSVALVAGTLGVNLAPSLIYRAEHGANPVLKRSAVQNERSAQALGLRLPNLILPAPHSRSPFLRGITARYDKAIAPGYCEACFASVGAVGTVGFGWLVLCGLGSLVGAAGWLGARRRFRHASAGIGIAIAVGTLGGFSSLLEFSITPDIRAWNRISVLIAFLSLLAVVLLLDSLLAWLHAKRAPSVLRPLLLSGLLALGVYDQTSSSDVPAYSAVATAYRSDRVFVSEIESRLPRDAGVFELPYVPFPEGYPATAVGDRVATYATKYEPLRGYLHSSTLRWSYGAIKGRPADWAAQLAGQPLSFVIASVAAVGFGGIWVDPAGFEDSKAARLRSALRSLLGVAPLLSPLGDLWFFDLRPYHARLQRLHAPAQLRLLRDRALRPLQASCAAGGLALYNPLGEPQPVNLTLRLARREGRSGGPKVVYPDSMLGPGSMTTLEHHLLLPRGHTFVSVSAAPSNHGFTSQIVSFTLTDPALAPFARGPASTLVPGLVGPPCPGAG